MLPGSMNPYSSGKLLGINFLNIAFPSVLPLSPLVSLIHYILILLFIFLILLILYILLFHCATLYFLSDCSLVLYKAVHDLFILSINFFNLKFIHIYFIIY